EPGARGAGGGGGGGAPPARPLNKGPGGRIKMGDGGGKPVADREAVARGSVAMAREALRLVRAGAVKKGDPLQAARVAGIMAAKQTSALIPLCHPLPLPSGHVELTPPAPGYDIEA